jgi:(1->4)-alpha-D-glucan 1-alpha-D-glucosylmutase
VPDLWLKHVTTWNEVAMEALEGVDPADAYMLYQTLFGAWPEGLATDDTAGLSDFAERVNAWQQKALREAKLRSSWEAPDEDYEARCKALVERLLDPARSAEFLADLAALVTETADAAQANSLAQVALRCTVPGVPDCYQGTELADLSLVDPDNRRPVDYPRRRKVLENRDDPKMALLAELLALRGKDPELFARGDYRPLTIEGAQADHILAFERHHGGKTLRIAVALRTTAVSDWGDTRIAFTGAPRSAAEIFADRTVYAALD